MKKYVLGFVGLLSLFGLLGCSPSPQTNILDRNLAKEILDKITSAARNGNEDAVLDSLKARYRMRVEVREEFDKLPQLCFSRDFDFYDVREILMLEQREEDALVEVCLALRFPPNALEASSSLPSEWGECYALFHFVRESQIWKIGSVQFSPRVLSDLEKQMAFLDIINEKIPSFSLDEPDSKCPLFLRTTMETLAESYPEKERADFYRGFFYGYKSRLAFNVCGITSTSSTPPKTTLEEGLCAGEQCVKDSSHSPSELAAFGYRPYVAFGRWVCRFEQAFFYAQGHTDPYWWVMKSKFPEDIDDGARGLARGWISPMGMYGHCGVNNQEFVILESEVSERPSISD